MQWRTGARGLVSRTGLAVVVALGAAAPAAADYCIGSIAGVHIDVTPGGTLASTDRCPNQNQPFFCENRPDPSGPELPMIGSVEPQVTQVGNTFTLRLSFPLTMYGNSQNNGQNGTSVDSRAKIFWFNRATAIEPCYCAPPIFTCCPPVGCGLPGATIDFDTGTTYVEITNLDCRSLPDLGTLSFSVNRCWAPFNGCERRDRENNIELGPTDLAGYLGCPVPPPDDCDTNSCRDCRPAGDGCSVGLNGRASCKFPASGAHFRYLAGGTGGSDFPGATAWRAGLGLYFSHDYAQRMVIDNPTEGIDHVWLITEGGSFREFRDPASGSGLRLYDVTLTAPSDEYRRLYLDTSTGGWQLDHLDGHRDVFGADGLWERTTYAADPANPKVATYSGGQLTRVDFPDGRTETFEYYVSGPSTGKLQSFTEVGVGVSDCALQPDDCRVWTFTWSGDELTLIDRPDGTAWELTYDPANNGNRPGYLTQVRLVAGAVGRIETAFEYDSFGNVVRSWRGDPSFTGPDAVDKQQLDYTNPILPTQTVVTEWLDETTTFATTYHLGRDPRSIKTRVTSISGGCSACGLTPDTSFEYTDAAHPLRESAMVDGRGNRTTYGYTAFGRMAQRTEAVGTGQERLTSYTYDSVFPALLSETETPSASGVAGQFRRETVVYDPVTALAGSQNTTGFEDGAPLPDLTTDYTYNPSGEVETVDPPGYGTGDVTTFTYDEMNVPGRNGHLPDSRIDPLVGATGFRYDPLNRRSRVIDPNGVETVTSYDPLGRVTEVRQLGAVPAEDLFTTYAYNGFGDLETVTLPRGNLVVYGYEPGGARRLISIERRPDAATPGERTFYALDGLGNRTLEELQRWDGSGWVTESATESVYSSRCHVDKVVRGKGTTYESTTEYCYDANDNLERVWDANHPRGSFPTEFTQYSYDPLDRLVGVSQPWGGAGGGSAVTGYGYDLRDHLDTVTDAEGNVTLYETGDRDLMTLEVSPVYSGPTPMKTYTYNLHGELETETDPRGITVTRITDALDRVTSIDYPTDDPLDTTYVYDDPAVAFSKGRLTAIVRGASTVDYAYDRFGRMTQDGDLGYAYDANGNRTEVRYPDGVTACYGHDFADRESSLSFSTAGGATPCAGATTSVVGAAEYYPSGPLRTASLGNGVIESRAFDQRYHPDAIGAVAGPSLLDWSYTTDDVGNVTAIDDLTPAGQDRSFGYQDHQYFLTSGAGPWGSQAWTYDRIGNRLTESDSTAPQPLAYDYLSNPSLGNTPLLDRVTPAPGNSGTGMLTYGYDAAGNQTSIAASGGELFGVDSLGYSEESRLAGLATDYGPAQTALSYDGRGFLRSSQLGYINSADTLTAEPTYGSDGLLYSRRGVRVRTSRDTIRGGGGAATTDKATDVFYFAGRPVAQRTVYVGGPTELLYLTTDHLGSPVLATDETGGQVWQGGFEPFGATFTFLEGTELFLRLPGQWQDPSWKTSGRVAELSYNVYRWYQSETGRFTRKDPLLDPYRRSVLGPVYQGMEGGVGLGELVADFESNHYAYTDQSPIGSSDYLGLQKCQRKGCDMVPNWLENRRRRACCECHDICYQAGECTARSWGHTVLTCLVPIIPRTPCDRCNRFVVRCFARSFIRLGTRCPWPARPPEQLYCQNPEPPVVPPVPVPISRPWL